MSSAFSITYWGVTGTMSAPLRPVEVTEKIVACLEELGKRGRLAHLQAGPGLRQAIESELQQLPFHLRSTFGGNTTSVEVQTPDGLLLLDCGSGVRELGRSLQQRWSANDYKGNRTAHVLVTHPHMDHSFGTPFFAPYYDPRNNFTIYATPEVLRSLEAVLSPKAQMSHVYFPPTFDMLKALRKLVALEENEIFNIGQTKISCYPLNHPGDCLAFRLECGGKVYVFATDHEQPNPPDMDLAEFVNGADVLYTEGQYTKAEYEGKEGLPGEPPLSRRGWGHSSIEACVTTCIAAGVKCLHLGHRDPARTDADLARLEKYAQDLAGNRCQVVVPFEGMTVTL